MLMALFLAVDLLGRGLQLLLTERLIFQRLFLLDMQVSLAGNME